MENISCHQSNRTKENMSCPRQWNSWYLFQAKYQQLFFFDFEHHTSNWSSNVLEIVTHCVEEWAPFVIIADKRWSNSWGLSLSLFTKLSIAFLLNCSDSPPSILRINASTIQDLDSSASELILDEDFKCTCNVINFGYSKLITTKASQFQRALLENLIWTILFWSYVASDFQKKLLFLELVKIRILALLKAKNTSKCKSYCGKMFRFGTMYIFLEILLYLIQIWSHFFGRCWRPLLAFLLLAKKSLPSQLEVASFLF